MIKKIIMRKLQYFMELFFFLNYVPSKYITVDYKDSVWIKQNTKSKIKTINLLQKQYTQNGEFEIDVVLFETFITELNVLISSIKNLLMNTLKKKLNNPSLQAKKYWSILKTFYNKKKFPLRPTLLVTSSLL